MGRSAFIALGTNLGARVGHMRAAVEFLQSISEAPIRASFLYETPPWGVLDQPPFLNAVAEIRTSLTPHDLLAELKRAEERLGRVYTRRWGPRQIDLDILLLGDDGGEAVDAEDLQVPHASMHEREFVLRPLCDIAPDIMHPRLNQPVRALLSALTPDPAIKRVVPVGRGLRGEDEGSRHAEEQCWSSAGGAMLMGVLNVTPDSFSDGGDHFTVEAAVAVAVQMAAMKGLAVIDIGGQSTRPGAEIVPVAEEIRRVVPVIAAIRTAGVRTPISVDTSRAEVAEAAIAAGADIVNDVTGGRGDTAMLAVAARLGVPVILMHSRGDPNTMNKLNVYDDLIRDVADEMARMVDEALAAGIHKWNIILDPGVGFAKKGGQNCLLLRSLPQVLDDPVVGQYPMLVGPSRKKFIATAAGRRIDDARERDWGTAAAVAACVQAGALLVRVHNVCAMADVVAVANAIWKAGTDW